MRVSAGGGTPAFVTRINPAKQEIGHGRPRFLSDGRRFLYYCRSTPDNTGIYVGTLDARPEEQKPKKIASTDPGSMYVPSEESGHGYLFLTREQTILAQSFDEKRLELTGEPIAIAEEVGFFSASEGILLYSSSAPGKQLLWVDRTGKELGIIGEAKGLTVTFDLTRDGSRLVVSRSLSTEWQNLWVMDLIRNTPARLTLESANHVDPRWSSDGIHVVFGSSRDISRSPFRVSLTSPDPVQVFKFTGRAFALDDWSADGRFLLYHDAGINELWAVPLEGDQKPVLAARSLSGIIDQAQFSPDGRWIAYNTNESGRFDVKVAPFPATGDKWQISTAGGVQPTWRLDGGELYFLAPDSTLMAVDVRSGKPFEYGVPHPLFKTQLTASYSIEEYHPAPDGKRFLLAKNLVDVSPAPFTVILNWTSLLRK
jgi:hypothetical protein